MTEEAHYLLGMELFGNDDLDGAIKEFQKALELKSDYGDVLHAIAMCYYHQEKYKKAIEYGEKLRQEEPNNTLAYTCLSMFYNAQGRVAKAEEMGAKAGAKAPPEEPK